MSTERHTSVCVSFRLQCQVCTINQCELMLVLSESRQNNAAGISSEMLIMLILESKLQ